MLKVALVAGAAAAALAGWGGWAVVTVKELPEYFVAGQQYTIEFEVRQHGRALLSGLEPQLVMGSSPRRLGGLLGARDEVTVAANAGGRTGSYVVTFTAPAVERLFLTLKSGFGSSQLRLYPQPVIAAGASRPVMSSRDRGQVLFIAKGCNVCHANSNLRDRPDNQTLTVGPDLGGRQLARDYVLQKIKTPASQSMPDIGLSDAEATALTAFLTTDRVVTAGGGGLR